MKKVDEAIFLHRTNYSESSLILSMYTRDSGLRKFIFKGGKKKAYNLYPLSLSEITYYGRKESELLQITAAEPMERYLFPTDPVRSTIAFFAVEVLRKCIHEGERDNRLYDFIIRLISELEGGENIHTFPIRMLIELSDFLGFKPLLEEPESDVFHLSEGRINRRNALASDVERGEHIVLISRLLHDPLQHIKPDRDTRDKALESLLKYYSLHQPGMASIKTLSIVKEVLS